jgi:hypothetical protein
MRLRLAAALFLLAASPALAAAEDCATRWYWNGFKCQPLQVYLPNDRDYWTRFFPEQGYPACTPDGCCPAGFTIQDKLCKPYVGR